MEVARVIIEVVAGVIPGTPIPEHTKRFGVSSDAWYGQGKYENNLEEARMEILQVYGTAQEYARNLMNPQILNWVKLEWVYL